MKWVRTTDDNDTFTMVIPGGVLYRFGYSHSMVFVPDPVMTTNGYHFTTGLRSPSPFTHGPANC